MCPHVAEVLREVNNKRIVKVGSGRLISSHDALWVMDRIRHKWENTFVLETWLTFRTKESI